MMRVVIAVWVGLGASVLRAQDLEVIDDDGLVTVGWDTQPGISYRLQHSADLATWTDADGGAWLYGLGQRVAYAVHSYDPAGGGSDPLPDPPSSSHSFLASEYAAQDKVLISWSGGDACQVLLARSDPRLPGGALSPTSVEVDDGAGGFYALALMPVGIPWQAAYASDPALSETSLDPGAAAQLAKLFGAKTEIEAATGPNTQASSTGPAGAASFFRLEVDQPDSDSDGAPDWQELAGGYDAFHPDTDRDGFPDGVEAELGTSLIDPLSFPSMSTPGAELFLQGGNVTLDGGP